MRIKDRRPACYVCGENVDGTLHLPLFNQLHTQWPVEYVHLKCLNPASTDEETEALLEQARVSLQMHKAMDKKNGRTKDAVH